MNPETAAVSSPSLLHCQHRSLSGRRFCRLPISDPDSGLCPRHAAEHQRDLDQADLAPALIGTIEEFRSAADINHSLGELYKLQARNKITPRRAAVMAYTASLLLRTLPAIEHEHNNEPIEFDFSDWDKPHPLMPPGTPPPPTDPSRPPGPAVYIRRLEALGQLPNANATSSQEGEPAR